MENENKTNKLKSVSDIYREYVEKHDPNTTFKEWLNIEKALHIDCKTKTDFDTWINRKYEARDLWWAGNVGMVKEWYAKVGNSLRESMEAMKQAINPVVEAILPKQEEVSEPVTASEIKKPVNEKELKMCAAGTGASGAGKKILGFHPAVAIIGTLVILGGIAYAGYLIFKPEKQS